VIYDGAGGTVRVQDRNGARRLILNGQVQGGSLLNPPAAKVDPRLGAGPGPVSESVYHLGWLLPALADPKASVLMIGLGSGAGIVQLLYLFPDIDVTCIDIDPVVIQTALLYYPLLNYYQDQGRLHIVNEDAEAYLKTRTETWGFGCADAYSGKSNDLETGYLTVFGERCDAVAVNVIDSLAGRLMAQVADVLAVTGHGVQEVFKAVPFGSLATYQGMSNWVLTDVEPDWDRLQAFKPFEDLGGVGAGYAQRNWEQFLSNASVLRS
jgi:hypothetical protein